MLLRGYYESYCYEATTGYYEAASYHLSYLILSYLSCMPGGHAWSADGIEWSKISGSNCEFAQNGRFSLSRPHKAANGSVVNATYCTERPKLPAACGRSHADGPLRHRVRDCWPDHPRLYDLSIYLSIYPSIYIYLYDRRDS